MTLAEKTELPDKKKSTPTFDLNRPLEGEKKLCNPSFCEKKTKHSPLLIFPTPSKGTTI